jgi:hypothetical protein
MPHSRRSPQLPLLALIPKLSRLIAAEQHGYRTEQRRLALRGRFREHGRRVKGSGRDVAREDVVVVLDGGVVQDGV